MKIAFLGLGAMGYPMAGHIANKTSHEVVVYNRSENKALRWQTEYPGTATNISEAVKHSEIIALCLGRDEDVLNVVLSDDFQDALTPGAIVVDHTTTSYQLTQTLAPRLKQRGVAFVDAPVSGGQDGATNGVLSTMMGGDAEVIKSITPILQTYCRSLTHMGAIGSGQLAKMANQICISGVLSGLSEALVFAEKQGLAIDKLLSAIGGGAAQSWQMDNRGPTMHQRQFDFGFAIEWFIKDLGYCLAQGAATHSDLSATQTTFDKYQALAEQGYHREDTSALIRWYDNQCKAP